MRERKVGEGPQARCACRNSAELLDLFIYTFNVASAAKQIGTCINLNDASAEQGRRKSCRRAGELNQIKNGAEKCGCLTSQPYPSPESRFLRFEAYRLSFPTSGPTSEYLSEPTSELSSEAEQILPTQKASYLRKSFMYRFVAEFDSVTIFHAWKGSISVSNNSMLSICRFFRLRPCTCSVQYQRGNLGSPVLRYCHAGTFPSLGFLSLPSTAFLPRSVLSSSRTSIVADILMWLYLLYLILWSSPFSPTAL